MIPSGSNNRSHLFFVLNNPDDDTEAALASLCSMHRRADRTCILSPEDHPFIRHESYIDYRLCRTDAVAHLERMQEGGYWTRREDAGEDLIERIVKGAWESKHTRPRILRLLA